MASITLTPELKASLKETIIKVWNDIAADALDCCDDTPDNEEAIEWCIDADRLLINGQSATMNTLVQGLCRMHGPNAVLKYLSSYIYLM